jgi:hypothetical protein
MTQLGAIRFFLLQHFVDVFHSLLHFLKMVLPGSLGFCERAYLVRGGFKIQQLP